MDSNPFAMATDVHHEVRQMIFDRKIAHDQQISVSHLAQILQRSQGEVKGVLARLEGEQLIVPISKDLFMVRQLRLEELIHLYELRISLEVQGARLFTQCVGQDKIDDLSTMLLPFGKGPKNAVVYKKIDWHFHDIIMRNTGNPFLQAAFFNSPILGRLALLGLVRPAQEIFEEHKNMVTFMHRRETRKVEALMYRHLDRCRRVFITELNS